VGSCVPGNPGRSHRDPAHRIAASALGAWMCAVPGMSCLRPDAEAPIIDHVPAIVTPWTTSRASSVAAAKIGSMRERYVADVSRRRSTDTWARSRCARVTSLFIPWLDTWRLPRSFNVDRFAIPTPLDLTGARAATAPRNTRFMKPCPSGIADPLSSFSLDSGRRIAVSGEACSSSPKFVATYRSSRTRVRGGRRCFSLRRFIITAKSRRQ
jgi:hypothetical protein